MPKQPKTANSLIRVSARNHAGLILMTELAQSADFVSLRDVAGHMGLSQGFLEEVAADLKNAGLIKGRKGPGGGYCLAKAAGNITAEQILTALEGPISLVACHGGACPVAAACASKSLWGFLQRDIIKSLKRTTLAEIVK